MTTKDRDGSLERWCECKEAACVQLVPRLYAADGPDSIPVARRPRAVWPLELEASCGSSGYAG
jgi:hypothetical protein